MTRSDLRLALFQPDIPQNAGALLRLGACWAVPVDLVEPAGFLLGDRAFRRAGMDYLDDVDLTRHPGWDDFLASCRRQGRRLVLLTTRADAPLHRFRFRPGDTLLLGRESAGVPDPVHAAADARLRIAMSAGMRALNVAMAGAIALGEALRQTGGLDALEAAPETPRP